MNIESAQWLRDERTEQTSCIRAIIDGVTHYVMNNPANRHYAEILKQVKEGTLTIKDAE